MAGDDKSIRFDVRLSIRRRDELQQLADQLGLSLADAVRLAVARFIEQRRQLLGSAP